MSKEALHIIILAAGQGKRMQSNLPKVLQPLGGAPMLAQVLGTARALNPAQIYVVYGHQGAQVQAAFPDEDIHWVEQAQQLGTGHAVLQVLPHIPDQAQVLILYGDVPLISLATLQNVLCQSFAVLVEEVHDPQGYGRVLCDVQQRVMAIIEQRDASLDQQKINCINTGVITAHAHDFKRWLAHITPQNAQQEWLLTDVFALAYAENKPADCVRCLESGEADGANDLWQLMQLERRLQLRRAQTLAQQGVRLSDAQRLDIRGEVVAASDCSIDAQVILEGRVVLAGQVNIGPFCRIKDCSFAKGTVIHAHCDLEGVTTHGPCSIGPFARLRPGTELAAGVQIGNFVEIKNTSVGTNSKASHLSYLGDAHIGQHVNVGAGTITCNYDGAKKHTTVIEDHVFIGSNSALIAPVTIGAHATIGAGSVISQSAPAHQLTLARATQKSVARWQRPQKD